ncbi:hypothetical protein LEP1GSC061_1256 [Leptospira wolffii serovar Khorat str. Khorat-H2]|nr:hypothetical protein LEP1GSC061_1256 [Leptospira wolffii serovar Khorat str. Khorat-H2]
MKGPLILTPLAEGNLTPEPVLPYPGRDRIYRTCLRDSEQIEDKVDYRRDQVRASVMVGAFVSILTFP